MSEQRLQELLAKKAALQQKQASAPNSILGAIAPESMAKLAGDPNTAKAKANDGFDIFRGAAIGLNQEGQMDSAARAAGVALDSPDVQAGIQTTQLLKLLTEIGLTNALTMGLGGSIGVAMKTSPKLAALATKIAKAEKIIGEGDNSQKVMRVLSDFTKGGAAAFGANAITNTGAAGLAAIGDPESFSGNLDETLLEAGGQGLIGGVTGAALGPAIRTSSRLLGANQVGRDVAEELNKQATKFTNLAENDSVAAVKKLYEARKLELAPIKTELDKIESALQKSDAKIKVSDLPKELVALMDNIKSGKIIGPENTSQVNNLKKVFSRSEDVSKPLGSITDASGKNININVSGKEKFINVSDVLTIKNNLEEVMDIGFRSGAKGDLAEFAGLIKRDGVLDKVKNLLPEEYVAKNNQYQKVLDKYGNPFDKDFSNLSKAYSKIKDGAELSAEEAQKALSATNSKKSRLLGDFVDKKLLTVDEVAGANVSAASKNKKTFIPPKLIGEGGDSLDLMKAGIDAKDVSFVQGREIANSPLTSKIGNALGLGKTPASVKNVEANRLLDPLDVLGDLTKKEGNIQAALGNTPEAAKLSGELDNLQFLKQQAVKGSKEAASEAGLGTKLLQGFDSGSANTESALKSLARVQLLNQMGPQAVRALMQSAGTSFFGNNQFGKAGY